MDSYHPETWSCDLLPFPSYPRANMTWTDNTLNNTFYLLHGAFQSTQGHLKKK